MKKIILLFIFIYSHITNAATGVFDMYSPDGLLINTDAEVTANIVYPGAGSAISSPVPFYGLDWVAHDITTYMPGTYTIDTIDGGLYTFTVSGGQIGMHMLFDWGATTDIDVVNVWDVSVVSDELHYTPIDWDGDGAPGGAMIDGPFPGFNPAFSLIGADLPLANYPGITLNGDSIVNLQVGDVYVDAGATAIDVQDGDLTSSIVTTNPVDTSVAGTYTVTYSVTDSDGYTTTATRTVNIVFGEFPVITLLGDSPLVINTLDTFVDPGATATDVEDGNLTDSIIVTHNVDTSVKGEYTVNYSVTDSHGNTTLLTRTVEVLDSVTGTFIMRDPYGNIIFTDNDVTATIIYPGAGSSISSPNAFYGLDWVAHDITTYQAGDYSIDTIEAGVLNFTVGAGQIGAHMLIDWGASTFDVVNVWDVTEVDGVRYYTETDWDGNGFIGGPMLDGPFLNFNWSFNLSGTVLPAVDNNPMISLIGDEIVYINIGDTYVDSGAAAFDLEDGDLTSGIMTLNPVNTSVIGSYTVTYSIADSDGNVSSVARTVVVYDSDSDGDGVLDSSDNCLNVSNPDQRDTDGDGYGNYCDADLNNNNIVNAIDLGIFRQRYFSTDADADFNGDGVVNAIDLGMFKQMYFKEPGPSGVL